MNTQKILASASAHLQAQTGHVFDILSISKPRRLDATINLAKTISKLSPVIGNWIEFNTVDILNDQTEYRAFGKWERQDPGFPDVVFVGSVTPTPGFEIKAWFPLATEMTARFKDSQDYFTQNQTKVCIIAWLPEKLLFGKPRIIDVCVVSGRSIAEARDKHYHNPPDYLVIEPGDTTKRTRNLQQSNTGGYKFQGTQEELSKAQEFVDRRNLQAGDYQTNLEYQSRIRELHTTFDYRPDTNFSKIDRIMHDGIEAFKRRVLDQELYGMSIKEWKRFLKKETDDSQRKVFKKLFGIREE